LGALSSDKLRLDQLLRKATDLFEIVIILEASDELAEFASNKYFYADGKLEAYEPREI